MDDDTPSWYRSRGYLHFDVPVGKKKAIHIATNPNYIKRHSFYPFINYAVSSKKINKDKSTGKILVKNKERPIAYSSHLDSHIYAFYSEKLSALYEDKLLECGLEKSVLAFRSLGKSNIDFAYEAFIKIKEMGECCAVALDFSKFFDTLNHDLLKKSWCKLINKEKLPSDHFNVFKSITKSSTVDKMDLYELFSISKSSPKSKHKQICCAKDFRDKVRGGGLIKSNLNDYGIPQGSPISALLSNIYMLDFDLEMKKYADIHGGYYFRYCDDMLFIMPKRLKENVAGFAEKHINKLKVHINPQKTEIRQFNKVGNILEADSPLQYLGFIFDGENIYLRSSSLARYSEKMRRGVSLAKQTMRKYNNIRAMKGADEKDLYKKKLYSRYTHLGGRNFITYGLRAANKMNSNTIKKQLKPLWRRFHEEIEKD